MAIGECSYPFCSKPVDSEYFGCINHSLKSIHAEENKCKYCTYWKDKK